MADQTVPVTYRKGKLRAGGLGALAKLKNGSAEQLLTIGDNGPEYKDLSDYLDNVIGSTRGALLMRGSSGWTKLDPGDSGTFLKSNGAGADPSYAAIPAPGYELIQSTSLSGDLAVTGLADYTSIIVVGRGVTSTGANARLVRVSTDNGSTFLSTSGDYKSIATNGAEASGTSIVAADSTVMTAAGFIVEFPNWNVAAAGKIAKASSGFNYYMPATGAFNALQAKGFGTSTLSGGTIDVFGIPS